MMSELPKLFTIKHAAKMLGVTTLTLRNWDKAGKLQPSRHPINNYRVYKREDIEKLLAEIGSNTQPTKAYKTHGKKGPRKLQVRHLE